MEDGEKEEEGEKETEAKQGGRRMMVGCIYLDHLRMHIHDHNIIIIIQCAGII